MGRVLGPSVVCMVQCDAAEGSSVRDGVEVFCLFLVVVEVGVFLVVVGGLFCFVGFLDFFLVLFLACEPVCCDMKIISPGHG